MMRRLLGIAAIVGLCFGAAPVLAQDKETLADIRQELTVLFVEIQKLKRELSTSGSAPGGGKRVVGSGPGGGDRERTVAPDGQDGGA